MKKLIVVVAVLAALCHLGSAIQCHQCNSHDDPECDDPFIVQPKHEGEKPTLKTDKFLKECPNNSPQPEYTLCRKIDQTVRGEKRTIRECGYEGPEDGCYRTVLEEYSTWVCQCSEEGCNSASIMSVSVITLALVYMTVYIVM